MSDKIKVSLSNPINIVAGIKLDGGNSNMVLGDLTDVVTGISPVHGDVLVYDDNTRNYTIAPILAIDGGSY